MRRAPNFCLARAHHGFVMIDVVLAMILLVAISTLVAVSATWSRRTADRLGDKRAAAALAESALVDLAKGHPAPSGVKVEPAAGGPTLAGHRWVRVTAAVGGRSVALVGLAKGAE